MLTCPTGIPVSYQGLAELIVVPITKIVKIKQHAIYDAFTRKMVSTILEIRADKTELFLSEFKDMMVPAARSVQCKIAISDQQNTNFNAFVFSDMEILNRGPRTFLARAGSRGDNYEGLYNDHR